MKALLYLILLVDFSGQLIFASEVAVECVVNVEINGVPRNAYYEIFKVDESISARYKGLFSDEVLENQKVIHYFYNPAQVQKYFVGNFRKMMGEIGEFNSKDVRYINQYGINPIVEDGRTVTTAQVLLFFNRDFELLSKVAIPGSRPVKCEL